MRLVLILLVACSSKHEVPPPSGPMPALACDYKADKLGTESHSCTEVRDPVIVESQRAWWAKVQGPIDKVTCTANARCPVEGRKGGCAAANGNVKWEYTEPASEIERVCTTGRFVALGQELPPMKYETFRCIKKGLCEEMPSVVDLLPTVTASNCKTMGAVFEKAACPTANVVGRCKLSSPGEEMVWSFYAPVTVEDARGACTKLEGTFVGG